MATLDDLNNASLPLNGDEFIHTRRALEDKVVTVDQMFEDRLGVFKTRNNTITLAEAVASTKANAGDIVIVSDRGNGLFEYKTGQTPNTYNIVACTGVPTLSLVLKLGGVVTVENIGFVRDGITPNDIAAVLDFQKESRVGVKWGGRRLSYHWWGL